MRIISQDGKYSINFDNCELMVVANTIVSVSSENRMCIGVYNSPERASEVFNDIHNAYSGMLVLFQNIDPSDDVRELMKKLEKRGIFTRCPDSSPKVEFVDNVVYRMSKE